MSKFTICLYFEVWEVNVGSQNISLYELISLFCGSKIKQCPSELGTDITSGTCTQFNYSKHPLQLHQMSSHWLELHGTLNIAVWKNLLDHATFFTKIKTSCWGGGKHLIGLEKPVRCFHGGMMAQSQKKAEKMFLFFKKKKNPQSGNILWHLTFLKPYIYFTKQLWKCFSLLYNLAYPFCKYYIV